MSEDIVVSTSGPVGRLTLNRPAQRNSFTTSMLQDLRRLLLELEADPDIRVVVIAGAGGVFSSGADLNEIVSADPGTVRSYNRTWIDLFATIERLDLPVVASVEGYAIAGGTELTLACDLVVAGTSARFGLSEARVGVLPGAGAAVRLTRWLGRAAAKEILFFGDPIVAERAHAIGLINWVVPDADLVDETQRIAERLASRSSAALRASKRAVNIASELDLDRGIEFVLDEFCELFGGPDQNEGMSAFLEKRDPRFARRRGGA